MLKCLKWDKEREGQTSLCPLSSRLFCSSDERWFLVFAPWIISIKTNWVRGTILPPLIFYCPWLRRVSISIIELQTSSDASFPPFFISRFTGFTWVQAGFRRCRWGSGSSSHPRSSTCSRNRWSDHPSLPKGNLNSQLLRAHLCLRSNIWDLFWC